jgi:hypothetical protein
MTINDVILVAPGVSDIPVPAGYYASGGVVYGDSNLISGNIRLGATIFGVLGDKNVVNTSVSPTVAADATDITINQKAYVNGVLVTGTHSIYYCSGSMNGTRWCDNGNGTVQDKTTGLIWLQDANCAATLAGIAKTGNGTATDRLDWQEAEIWSSALASGSCGLTDGSTAGTWRQPTKYELTGLTYGPTEPVRFGSPRNFTHVQSGYYWSSSTYSSDTTSALLAYMNDFFVGNDSKTYFNYVWPVRAGQ